MTQFRSILLILSLLTLIPQLLYAQPVRDADYSQMRSSDLEKLSAEGDDRASFQMATRALKGLGEPNDADKAFVIFKRLADKGSSEAQLNVGRMYAQGKGTVQDILLAKQYLEQPAKQGDGRALFILANIEEKTAAGLARAYSLYKLVSTDDEILSALRSIAQDRVMQLTKRLSLSEQEKSLSLTKQWLGWQN